jgi:hypothetical protein
MPRRRIEPVEGEPNVRWTADPRKRCPVGTIRVGSKEYVIPGPKFRLDPRWAKSLAHEVMGFKRIVKKGRR